MNFNQKTFSGGLDTLNHDSQISSEAYAWLINGRNRFGKIDPIPKHLNLTGAPAGLKQGIIGLGNIIVLFVAGKAYYQKVGDSLWLQIPAFSMDPLVDRYFTLAVPASYLNFVRKTDGSNISAPIINSTDFKISGTPAAIIVQDTINQPWLIIYDTTNQIFTARVSKNYADWNNVSQTADDREYIPIGGQMMYLNGKTFIVSRDRKSVYQSISGRPLDFMMNVDQDGNKAPSELAGGAATTSFSFDFDEIVNIQPVNIPDSFMYGTIHNTRIFTLDYTNTIFGEPTYRVSTTINTGMVNSESWLELVGLGDYAFIGFDAIISFNAVQTLKFAGRSSVFSLSLSKLFHNIRQANPACILFKNFAIFCVDTILGNLMCVYDTLRNQGSSGQSINWTSFDITDIINVKQFAILETIDDSFLYCITRNNEVWQMFASETEVYLTSIKTRGHMEQESDVEHKSILLRPVFQNGSIVNGECRVVELVDDMFSSTTKQPLTTGVGGINYPVQPPIIPSNISQVDNPAYQLKDGLMGKKISFILNWNVKASLVEYKFMSIPKQSFVSQKQTNNTLT